MVVGPVSHSMSVLAWQVCNLHDALHTAAQLTRVQRLGHVQHRHDLEGGPG